MYIVAEGHLTLSILHWLSDIGYYMDLARASFVALGVIIHAAGSCNDSVGASASGF